MAGVTPCKQYDRGQGHLRTDSQPLLPSASPAPCWGNCYGSAHPAVVEGERPWARSVETRRLIAILEPAPAALAWYRGTLRQGWKRQLRRMFAAVDAPIERLVRVRIGPIWLAELHTGSVRRLTASEARSLAPAASHR